DKLRYEKSDTVDSACVDELSHLFFSSRRRHTRSKRDWSSDVCSSDLIKFSLRKRESRFSLESPGKIRTSNVTPCSSKALNVLTSSSSTERALLIIFFPVACAIDPKLTSWISTPCSTASKTS